MLTVLSGEAAAEVWHAVALGREGELVAVGGGGGRAHALGARRQAHVFKVEPLEEG